jgi:hypothetical protein
MKKTNKSIFLPQVCLLAVILVFAACRESAPLTIYLVRHAEKDLTDKGEDPALTEAGIARAGRLKALLADEPIDLIYSTRYQRNIHTVEPLALAKGLPIAPYEWHGWEPMLEELTGKGAGKTAVICGHGDNLLPMIGFLNGNSPLDSLGAYEYDKIFKVTVKQRKAAVELLTY